MLFPQTSQDDVWRNDDPSFQFYFIKLTDNVQFTFYQSMFIILFQQNKQVNVRIRFGVFTSFRTIKYDMCSWFNTMHGFGYLFDNIRSFHTGSSIDLCAKLFIFPVRAIKKDGDSASVLFIRDWMIVYYSVFRNLHSFCAPTARWLILFFSASPISAKVCV